MASREKSVKLSAREAERERKAKLIRERLQHRLDVMGLSSYEASTLAGLNETHLQGIFAGRTKIMQLQTAIAVAKVLNTSAPYLLGRTDDEAPAAPAPATFPATESLQIIARTDCHSDRLPQEPQEPPFTVAPDSRFPGARQVLYLHDDDTLRTLGVFPGDLLAAVNAEDYGLAVGPVPAGAIVVCEISGNGGKRTLTAGPLTYKAGQQWACGLSAPPVVSVVTRIIRSV